MWVNGKWYEECEISAYVRKLEKERDAYKEELKNFLRKACDPSKVDVYAAKLRLEGLK